MYESVVGCLNTQYPAPECDPLHGRHYRQHLEGETATTGEPMLKEKYKKDTSTTPFEACFGKYLGTEVVEPT